MRREGEGRGAVACGAEEGEDIEMANERNSKQGRREEVQAMNKLTLLMIVRKVDKERALPACAMLAPLPSTSLSPPPPG